MIGEMASLETLGLREGSNLEVEVYFNLEVSVPGKGSSYITKIEVSPDEVLAHLETKVSFFNMFKQRGFQIFAPDLDRVIEFNELSTLLFRESGLKNMSKLVLLEPPKRKRGPDGEELSEFESDNEQSDDDEEGEEEMEDMEDEIEEGDADGDKEVDDAGDDEEKKEEDEDADEEKEKEMEDD